MRKKSKLTKWIKRFWDFVRKTKLIIILCCLVVVVVLMMMIMLKQRDIGAYEAGMQIEQLANIIRGHYKMRPDYWGLNTDEIIKNNLYPEDMSVNGGKLLGYFGNPVEIGMDTEGMTIMPTIKEFGITYRDLTKAQCTALASDRFRKTFWLGIKEISITDNNSSHTFGWDDKESVLPLDKRKADDLCHNGSNVLFRFE